MAHRTARDAAVIPTANNEPLNVYRQRLYDTVLDGLRPAMVIDDETLAATGLARLISDTVVSYEWFSEPLSNYTAEVFDEYFRQLTDVMLEKIIENHAGSCMAHRVIGDLMRFTDQYTF